MPLETWFDELGGLTPIEGVLHRSPIPFTRAHFQVLREAGIEAVFSLEEAVPGHLAIQAGLDWRPHFWTDDAPPTPAQMTRFLEDLFALPDQTRVVVHCKAGWGRAGTALSCALVAKHGWSADKAMGHVWARVPPSRGVMTRNGQADFVRGYAASLKGRGLF